MFGLMQHEGRDRIGTKGMGFPYLVQRKEKMEGKEFAWLHLSSLFWEKMEGKGKKRRIIIYLVGEKLRKSKEKKWGNRIFMTHHFFFSQIGWKSKDGFVWPTYLLYFLPYKQNTIKENYCSFPFCSILLYFFSLSSPTFCQIWWKFAISLTFLFCTSKHSL